MRSKLVLVAVLAVALLAAVVGSVYADSPGWITSCNYSHSNNSDPIVFPGQPGVAHLHDFIGAKSTNAFSTFASLRAGGTTCVQQGDTSAYWSPAVYKNGVRVLPTATSKDALFYYRRKGAPGGTVVKPFPNGLRMIAGNAHATSPAQNPGLGNGRIIFKCGPGSGTNLPHPPSQCSSGVMVISLQFPNCWDGKNLDSPDHM
jgi:hypothetical protein